MATVKDIATHTKLGLATISKYLNGGNVLPQNREAIDAAIQELGYTVNETARGLKTNRSRCIGVVIPELNNLFITTIITTIEDILRRRGYAVMISDCRTDPGREQEAILFMLKRRVDGIINMPVDGAGAHLLPALSAGLPVVLLDRMVPALEGRVSSVLVDNEDAAEQAVSALLAAGHTEIGIVLGPENVYTTGRRLAGARHAMANAGLAVRPALVRYADYTVQGGYEAARALLAEEAPTALFVTNYEMTLGTILYLNERGMSFPKDISLVGFDNLQLASILRPRLSVMSQPLALIAQHAAKRMLAQLEENAAPAHVILLAEHLPGETIQQAKEPVL